MAETEADLTLDRSGRLATLVSFRADSSRFGSNYDRNKFYRGLYGWKQTIKKCGKKYVYQHEGLLDRIPHIKVGKSVYIVPTKYTRSLTRYLDRWKGKVEYKVFKVLLEEDRFKKIQEQTTQEEGEWTEIPVK